MPTAPLVNRMDPGFRPFDPSVEDARLQGIPQCARGRIDAHDLNRVIDWRSKEVDVACENFLPRQAAHLAVVGVEIVHAEIELQQRRIDPVRASHIDNAGRYGAGRIAPPVYDLSEGRLGLLRNAITGSLSWRNTESVAMM